MGRGGYARYSPSPLTHVFEAADRGCLVTVVLQELPPIEPQDQRCGAKTGGQGGHRSPQTSQLGILQGPDPCSQPTPPPYLCAPSESREEREGGRGGSPKKPKPQDASQPAPSPSLATGVQPDSGGASVPFPLPPHSQLPAKRNKAAQSPGRRLPLFQHAEASTGLSGRPHPRSHTILARGRAVRQLAGALRMEEGADLGRPCSLVQDLGFLGGWLSLEGQGGARGGPEPHPHDISMTKLEAFTSSTPSEQPSSRPRSSIQKLRGPL